MKITFMGAGSTVFARNVIGDCMASEVLRDSVFALYDIDGERLKQSETILRALQKSLGSHGKITAHLGIENRKEALRGAEEALQSGMTLDAVSVNIDDALSQLLELTGERVTQAVVDGIFARFCVGK